MDIKKKSFSEWNRMPTEVVESLFLEVFRESVGVLMNRGSIGGRWTAGLDDLRSFLLTLMIL